MGKSRKIYKIEIAEIAADFIRTQTKKIQRQIFSEITSLAQEPYGKGRRIKNSSDVFKIRPGCYRIAYSIKEDRLLVLVIRIGHRKDFYRYYDH